MPNKGRAYVFLFRHSVPSEFRKPSIRAALSSSGPNNNYTTFNSTIIIINHLLLIAYLLPAPCYCHPQLKLIPPEFAKAGRGETVKREGVLLLELANVMPTAGFTGQQVGQAAGQGVRAVLLLVAIYRQV